jgi:MATE family multidrug resistance protein
MSLAHESRITLTLALPLMIGQLSQMLLGVADTVMVGHLGVTELAALTFANSLFYVPFVFGIGLLTGVSVMTSNARGADQAVAARASCRHGLYLATALGVLLLALSWWISMNLEMFGQAPQVTARTPVFFRIIMASMIPALAAVALKNHADALNRPWPPFWIFLGGVVLNIGLNWILIYGKLGAPELGLEGAAWATLISRMVILVAMIIWLLRAGGLREWVPYHWFRKPELPELGKLLSVGFPASIQMLFEVSAFSLAGLLMGHIGQVAMASHQIAITLAGTAFMIPLGLSMALTVRMGEAWGAGDTARLRPIMLSGWILAAGYSLLGATVFLTFGKQLAAMFIANPAVISLTASLLVVVGVFQLFDSLQVVSSAMLRGMHDARVPALMGFTSYWIVGLPVGAALAFQTSVGPVGVWWGLAIGLFVAALTLLPRLWWKVKHSKL